MKFISQLLLSSVLFLTALVNVNAQTVLGADPEAKAYPSNLDFMQGIVGRWLATDGTGPREVIFSEERFGQIIGHFTFWNDEGISLIELGSYYENNNSVTYRAKHFSADFVGRQEKDTSVERRLLDYKDGVAYFENMTLRLDGDRLTVNLKFGERISEAKYARAND